VTCIFHLERFVETSGTYKLVTMIGFEKFAQALGKYQWWKKADRQRDRDTERQRDRETERQRDRETERQRDRQSL
jgi:hypothetical protein